MISLRSKRGFEPFRIPYGEKALETFFRGTIRNHHSGWENYTIPNILFANTWVRPYNPLVKRPRQERRPDRHTTLRFRMPDGYQHEFYLDPDVWTFNFHSEVIYTFPSSGGGAVPMMSLPIDSTLFRPHHVVKLNLIFYTMNQRFPLYVRNIALDRRHQ